MPLLHTARFHTTVATLAQLPREVTPELAFVGRSNAGKSSAINRLCNRRKLAFSSRTPGRTQALNYFAVGPASAPSAYLVDTPGYGYAAAPLATKRSWDQLAGRYLHQRPQLMGVVLLLDIRRGFTALDQQLMTWIAPEVRLTLVLTKADKLGRQQANQALQSAQKTLSEARPGSDDRLLLFSALNRTGSDTLATWLEHDILSRATTPPAPSTDAGAGL